MHIDVRSEKGRATPVASASTAASADAPLPWWWNASLLLLAFAFVAFRLAHTEADPDLWGHVRFGLDLIDTRDLYRPDIYSYLSGLSGLSGPSDPSGGMPWINHEWLSELLMAIAWRGAGATGLIALKTALGLAVAVLVARHLLRQQVSLLATLFITAYGMVVLYPGLRPMRPQAFTYLCLTLLLLVIASTDAGADAAAGARDRGRARVSLWWTLPIMAIWANLHGGFVAGLGILAIWWSARAAAARLGVTTDTRLARDAGVILAAFAATLLTPYGWHMWRFLGRTLVPRPEISEWLPMPIATFEGVIYLLVCAFGIVGLLRQAWPRRTVTLPLLACGILLPLTARRHLPLLAIIVLVFCAGDAAHAITDAVSRRWPRMMRAPSQRGRPLIAAALVLEALVILALARPEWTRIAVDPAAYPIAAVDRLVSAGQPANLAVFFDWGEYVLWHAGPRIKVSVDGRRETVYPDDVYRANMAFTDGAGDWDRLLAMGPADAALVSVATPAAALLALHPAWELIMRDEQSALYARRGAPFTAALHATRPRSLDRPATFP